MKPYPRNSLNIKVITPNYRENESSDRNSRYFPYRIITNLDEKVLEVKMSNAISQNQTYKGYYYTTVKNETLYHVAKKYYDNENLWWIIAKANNLKNEGSLVLPKGTNLSIPSFSELQVKGGYFNAV